VSLAAQPGIVIAAPAVDTLADGSIIVSAMLAGSNLIEGNVLVALRDANHDHQITTDEIVQVWSYAKGDFWCSYDDMQALPDGSVLCLSLTNNVFRLVDANQDGTFDDIGEQYVAWDRDFAAVNGQTLADVGINSISAVLK